MLRQYSMGLIVALAGDDPFPGTKAEWSWVLSAVGPDRWLWYQRHGISTLRENPDYWNFLIPGVGLAPVTEFCVLITLFVLAIGPLNYWLLRRWGRLHLLVVTIPGGAAAVTSLLFLYALVGDGLHTRVRVRSVTHLDERRGQASCWARLSYYAGLAPGRGLTFPGDVAVLPLEHIPVPRHTDDSLRRELIWEEDQEEDQQAQWLASGWLRSRTPTQYLTVRSRPSNLGLRLRRSDDNPGELRVENRLNTRIQRLVVRSIEGNCYWSAGVDRDATATLEPIELAEARARLRRICLANLPAVPDGIRGQYYRRTFGLSPRYYYGYRQRYGNAGITGPKQETNRLEESLADDVLLLMPGSYVAVVEQSPEVELGIPSGREEAGYHVILGKW